MARQGILSGTRGAVLTAALISALLASIASYLVLQLAMVQARYARFHEGHAEARHAAEAGLVWAYERLLSNPAYCGAPDPPPLGALTVDVTISDCAPGNPKAITAKVTY